MANHVSRCNPLFRLKVLEDDYLSLPEIPVAVPLSFFWDFTCNPLKKIDSRGPKGCHAIVDLCIFVSEGWLKHQLDDHLLTVFFKQHIQGTMFFFEL